MDYYHNFSKTITPGREFLNRKKMPEFARTFKSGDRILEIGTHIFWDYSSLFNNVERLCKFETLEKDSNLNPTYTADIQECPEIPSDRFDGIYMIGVYEFLDYTQEMADEIYRMLKPDGRALIVYPGYQDGQGFGQGGHGTNLCSGGECCKSHRKPILEIMGKYKILDISFAYEGNKHSMIAVHGQK